MFRAHSGERRLKLCAAGVLLLAAAMTHGNARADSYSVSVIDNGYVPEPIVIGPGTTITWKNTGKEAHSVSSDDGTGESFNSGTLSPGQSYSHTFSEEGALTYHCVFHEDMLGTVIVQKPGEGNGTPATIQSTAQPKQTPKGKSKRVASNTVVAATVKGRYRFTPSILQTKAGSKVTWKNSTAAPHTVTSRGRSWSLNKTFGAHSKVAFVFRKPGTFIYYCKFHPGMKGRIVVRR